MLAPVRASALHVLLSPIIMAAHIYTVEQIENTLNLTLRDSANEAISEVNFFVKPL